MITSDSKKCCKEIKKQEEEQSLLFVLLCEECTCFLILFLIKYFTGFSLVYHILCNVMVEMQNKTCISSIFWRKHAIIIEKIDKIILN